MSYDEGWNRLENTPKLFHSSIHSFIKQLEDSDIESLVQLYETDIKTQAQVLLTLTAL